MHAVNIVGRKRGVSQLMLDKNASCSTCAKSSVGAPLDKFGRCQECQQNPEEEEEEEEEVQPDWIAEERTANDNLEYYIKWRGAYVFNLFLYCNVYGMGYMWCVLR